MSDREKFEMLRKGPTQRKMWCLSDKNLTLSTMEGYDKTKCQMKDQFVFKIIYVKKRNFCQNTKINTKKHRCMVHFYITHYPSHNTCL